MVFAAAILAAGRGVRFGDRTLPKQFETIGAKPVFVYSVELYRQLESVDSVVLVANPALLDETREILERHGCADGVTVVPGGETRRVSIDNAIGWLDTNHVLSGDDRIILHNAASPNTRDSLVRRCIDVAKTADAVQACMPETRTVFYAESDRVASVLRRDRHVISCDPTVYRFSVLREALAHQQRSELPGEATTDIVHALGYQIELVSSDADNIKITTRGDLAALTDAMTRSGRAG